jgi:hypothetical protein
LTGHIISLLQLFEVNLQCCACVIQLVADVGALLLFFRGVGVSPIADPFLSVLKYELWSSDGVGDEGSSERVVI